MQPPQVTSRQPPSSAFRIGRLGKHKVSAEIQIRFHQTNRGVQVSDPSRGSHPHRRPPVLASRISIPSSASAQVPTIGTGPERRIGSRADAARRGVAGFSWPILQGPWVFRSLQILLGLNPATNPKPCSAGNFLQTSVQDNVLQAQ